MKRTLASIALSGIVIVVACAQAQAAVAGKATASVTCAGSHVQLTVRVSLPPNTVAVRYTSSGTGTFLLGTSTAGGTATVHVTRRSGRTAESYNLVSNPYPALRC